MFFSVFCFVFSSNTVFLIIIRARYVELRFGCRILGHGRASPLLLQAGIDVTPPHLCCCHAAGCEDTQSLQATHQEAAIDPHEMQVSRCLATPTIACGSPASTAGSLTILAACMRACEHMSTCTRWRLPSP